MKTLRIPKNIEIPPSIERLLEHILSVCQPDEIILFGSRSKGSSRPNSDFDIAIKAKNLNFTDWTKLLMELEAQPITLQKVDLVHFEQMNDAYQKNINREGIKLYG